MEELLYNDLLPFRAGIAAGNPMLMVTHNTYEVKPAGRFQSLRDNYNKKPYLFQGYYE